MKEALDLSMVPYSRQMGDDKSDQSGNEIDIKPVDNKNRPRFMVEPVTTAIKTGGGKLQVKYRECMRNHAASIGGHANDGCGEFMQGAVEPLRCAACGCHRNFHRKEVQGGGGCVDHHHHHLLHPPPPPPSNPNMLIYATNSRWEKKKIQMAAGGGFPSLSSLSLPQQQQQQHHSNNNTTNFHHRNGGLFGTVDQHNNNEDQRSETPEDRGGGGGGGGSVRSSSKRFRTKFSQEQKEKMLEFAERLGWRIQKHDDVALSQFCLEVGVKRQVLKVWMHNNKNTFRKRDPNNNVTSPPPPPPPPPAVQLQSPPPSPPPSSINGV